MARRGLKSPDEAQGGLDDAVLLAADTIGGLMEFWGFKRALGRMWTALYLSPRPRSALELGEQLGMSTGGVSMTLQELAKWGVVKRAWRPGERRDYYEPETSIWKMVSRVFRERELVEIRAAIERLELVTRALQAASRERPQDRQTVRFVTDRIEGLLALARLGDTLLSAILAGERLDLKQLRSFAFLRSG